MDHPTDLPSECSGFADHCICGGNLVGSVADEGSCHSEMSPDDYRRAAYEALRLARHFLRKARNAADGETALLTVPADVARLPELGDMIGAIDRAADEIELYASPTAENTFYQARRRM